MTAASILGGLNERASRWEKIARLLAAMHAAELGPGDLKHIGEGEWELLAGVAGVRPPSAKTVDMIRELLTK